MKQTDIPDSLTVIARSPFNVYYEGPAQSLSAINRVGPFDILPGHADFFSVLNAGEIIIEIKPGADPVSFMVNNGIITVRDNEVLLFVDM
jgi:F0F1-type ATP synthase epsilon subunit